MTLAVEISLLSVVIVLLGVIVLITVQFSTALGKALSHADRTHERQIKALESLLDRFMALDFSIFKAAQSADGFTGGFEEPESFAEAVFREEAPVERTRGFFSRRKAPLEDVPEDPTELEEFAHLATGAFIGREGFDQTEEDLADVEDIRELMGEVR